MFYKIILCVSETYGIGYKNNLPWKIKEEMIFFKKQTLYVEDKNKKNCIVMGRKTFENIISRTNNKNGLEGRINIVLTNDKNLKEKYIDNENIKIVNSFKEMKELLKFYENINIIENVYFIGGKTIFNYAFEKNYIIYLSIINEKYVCDTYINEINLNSYKIISHKIKNQYCNIKDKSVKVDYFILKK